MQPLTLTSCCLCSWAAFCTAVPVEVGTWLWPEKLACFRLPKVILNFCLTLKPEVFQITKYNQPNTMNKNYLFFNFHLKWNSSLSSFRMI